MGKLREVGESSQGKKRKNRKHKEVYDEKNNDIEGLGGDIRPRKKNKGNGSLNKLENSSGISGKERDVMNSEVGVITEEVKLEKDKKEKKKKSKPGFDSVGVYGHVGTDEKQISVDSVKNKKQKEKVNGVGDKELRKKNDVFEVTEVVERAEGRKKKKKKKKKEKEKDLGSGNVVASSEEGYDAVGCAGLVEDRVGIAEEVESVKKNEKRKKKKDGFVVDSVNDDGIKDGASKKRKKKVVAVNSEKNTDGGASVINDGEGIKDGASKKRKKKLVSTNSEESTDGGASVINDGEGIKDGASKKRKKKLVSTNSEESTDGGASVTNDGESIKGGASKKRKKKSVSTNSEESTDAGASLTSRRTELSEGSEKSNMSKKSRKVKFSDSVEVFTLTDNSNEGDESGDAGGSSGKGREKADDGKEKNSEDGLVQGKRFTKDEDEILRNAVLKFIEDHRLGEEGVQMIMKCGKHRSKFKDCWGEIGQSLPWRSKLSVYSRAHILFERSENHKWTKEELEMVRKYHEKHGPKWRPLADEMGRNRIHVKDAYRQVKLPNKKTGNWSQEEYQTLFDLVNKDLRIRANMERKSKHGMLRDNIGWEAISQLLETRTDPLCCHKWYNQLSSVLVSSGKWADTDDYRMLMALVDLDATCEEEVDWDNVLEHRSGDLCRKRWYEMVRHIGEHGTKSFSQQVELLSQRYCPDVLDAREAYESKPFVDL